MMRERFNIMYNSNYDAETTLTMFYNLMYTWIAFEESIIQEGSPTLKDLLLERGYIFDEIKGR